MARHSAELRIRLIRRILELSDEQLAKMERLIDGLEPQANESSKGEFQSSVKPEHSQMEKCWPHAPVHRVNAHGTYIVTAATLYKQHLFQGDDRLDFLESKLLELAQEHGWELEAWAVFSNH